MGPVSRAKPLPSVEASSLLRAIAGGDSMGETHSAFYINWGIPSGWQLAGNKTERLYPRGNKTSYCLLPSNLLVLSHGCIMPQKWQYYLIRLVIGLR